MKVKNGKRGKAPFVVRRRDVSEAASLLFFEALGSPLESSVFQGDFLSVVTAKSPDPAQFDSASLFRDEYWASEAFSKFPFEVGIDREVAAMQSFLDAEDLCRDANHRLTEYFSRPRPANYRRWMKEARRRCHWLLGGISPDEIFAHAGWGPGASTDHSRQRSSRQTKWEFATHATRGALPYTLAMWRYAALPKREFGVVGANRVTTVPKNAKTDRTIAIEPSWNMFFQKGLGHVIRTRLQKRVGLLHPDAQQRNKQLALVGSRTQSFATIDLKGASDSISLALCELLLPSDLFRHILALRSPFGEVWGQTVEFEKVSSMGNGFTFELETALFWALASSVSGHAVCYGDDIIVPQEYASSVIDLLSEAGFRVNEKKTFVSGPFRESCGGHYFHGVDVTPPYFKKRLDNVPDLISGSNKLSFRCTAGGARDARFEECWRLISRQVPRFLTGPQYAGDTVLHVPFDECRPKFNSSLQCFTGPALRKKRKLRTAPVWGAIQASLHGDTRTENHASEEEIVYVHHWNGDRWSDVPPWL